LSLRIFPFVESHQLVVGYVIAKQTVVSSHPHIPVVIANAVDGVDVLLQYIFQRDEVRGVGVELNKPIADGADPDIAGIVQAESNSPRYVESLGMIFSTARVCVSI
jgi:hypothetical protein